VRRRLLCPDLLALHLDPRIFLQGHPAAHMILDQADLAIGATGTKPPSTLADRTVAVIAEQAE